MMTMMGIISLAGIVVNNGVVLLDYTQLLIDRRMVELKMDDHDLLPKQEVKQLIIRAGKRVCARVAYSHYHSTWPDSLAAGFNMDFFSLFNDFNPKYILAGDNVIFWGPLAWAVIYGLIIATF